MTLHQETLLSLIGRYRILLDADILLELLHNRSPFVEEAEQLCKRLQESEHIDFFITDQALKRIEVYAPSFKEYINFAHFLSGGFDQNIISVNAHIIEKARRLYFPDFDSATEYVCAKEHDLDAIITQNPSNYTGADIPIWSISNLDTRIVFENQFTPLKRQQQSKLNNDKCFEAYADGRQIVRISASEVERFSFSLPALEAQRLREAAKKSSVSKMIRDSLHLQLYLEEQIADGGEIYVKTGTGELLKLIFGS